MKPAATTIALLALGMSLAWNYSQFHQTRALEWDVMYWRGELFKMYTVQTEPLLDGQCCNADGEGCNVPIYGSDC